MQEAPTYMLVSTAKGTPLADALVELDKALYIDLWTPLAYLRAYL